MSTNDKKVGELSACYVHPSTSGNSSNDGFLNEPITAHTQILVHSWVPRTRISVLRRRLLLQQLKICTFLKLDWLKK